MGFLLCILGTVEGGLGGIGGGECRRGGEVGSFRLVSNRKGLECMRGCRKFFVLEGGRMGEIGISLILVRVAICLFVVFADAE